MNKLIKNSTTIKLEPNRVIKTKLAVMMFSKNNFQILINSIIK